MGILDKFISKASFEEKELIRTLQKAPISNNPWDNAYIVKLKYYKGKNKGKILLFFILCPPILLYRFFIFYSIF